jgi:signal transduction histidine kinase
MTAQRREDKSRRAVRAPRGSVPVEREMRGECHEQRNREEDSSRDLWSYSAVSAGALLDLSKIEAGMLELNPQTVQLTSLINEVIGTAGQLAEQNNNRLVVDAQENLGAMTVDPLGPSIPSSVQWQNVGLTYCFYLALQNASASTVLGTTNHQSDRAEVFSFLFKHLRSPILVTVI